MIGARFKTILTSGGKAEPEGIKFMIGARFKTILTSGGKAEPGGDQVYDRRCDFKTILTSGDKASCR